MSNTARFAIGIILLTLPAPGPLAARDGKAAVEGTVFDSSGRVLVGADVFLRDLHSGLEIHQVTGNEGRFQFLVDQGRYQVTAAMSGFDSATQDLDLEESGPADLRIQLAPAALDTQVVVVSGSREQELIENSTTKVDVIPKRILHDSGYETVRDVLAEEPGIVTRSGSSGSRSETQIQGIDSRQSLILIDGLPVVGAKGIKRGILNMDRQSVGRLERIEIVKGASSAVYGSDAIGGVINMITREPRYPLEASVTTSGGSLNRFDMRADVGFVKDKWSGFFEAERHKQNPFSLVPSQFGTTAPGFHRYDYLGKLGYDISDRLKLRATAHAFVNQDKGAYFSEFGPTDSTTDDTAQHYSLSADIGVTPLTHWNVRGFYGKYDESSVLDVLPQPGPVNSVANLNQRLYRLDSSISHVLGARQLLQGGVEWTQDEYRGFNRVLGDNDGQGIDMVDLWINDRISLHDRFVLTLGSRFNRHNLYGSHFVPRASGLFRVAGNFRLRGTVGRGFRAPDLGQLYFRFQNPTHHYQVIGNTHLQPERSTTYQAGFDYGADTFRFATNFFRNDIQELIQAEYIGFPTNPGEMQGLLRTYGIANRVQPGPLPGLLPLPERGQRLHVGHREQTGTEADPESADFDRVRLHGRPGQGDRRLPQRPAPPPWELPHLLQLHPVRRVADEPARHLLQQVARLGPGRIADRRRTPDLGLVRGQTHRPGRGDVFRGGQSPRQQGPRSGRQQSFVLARGPGTVGPGWPALELQP